MCQEKRKTKKTPSSTTAVKVKMENAKSRTDSEQEVLFFT